MTINSVIRQETPESHEATRRWLGLSILRRLAGLEGIKRGKTGADDHDSAADEAPAGTMLAELLRRGPMAVDDLIALADELTGIIAAVHRRGVIHKDINPGNILLAGVACTAHPHRFRSGDQFCPGTTGLHPRE
jgi:hypothetical protein